MRVRKFLTSVLLLLIAGLGIGIAILKSVDFNEYRDLIAQQVLKATGRQLTLAGDLNLELSLTPTLSARNIGFANASWGSRPKMVKVERFEAQLALLPLLVGDVHISRIRLIGVDLFLEVDGKGHGNWEVGTAKQRSGQQSPAPLLGVDMPLVNELLVERVRLTYRDLSNGVKHSVKLNTGTVRIPNRHSPIEVELRGAIDSHPVQLSAELGSLIDLMEDSSYGLKLNAQAGDTNIAVAGAVAKPREGIGLNVRVSGSGKNLESVSGIVGASLPPVGPYSFAIICDPRSRATALA